MSDDFQAEWEVNRQVVRRCVCRGPAIVVEEFPSPVAIHAAVVVHQESTEHELWTVRGGMGEPTFPVPSIPGVRKRRTLAVPPTLTRVA